MNWRGISGIYAGFALVLGGLWLWVRLGSVWALAAICAGVVLAVASIVWIVLARRGPRPSKRVKSQNNRRSKVPDAQDLEADAIAKTRLAALADRTSERTAAVGPVETIDPRLSTGGVPDTIEPSAFESSAFDALVIDALAIDDGPEDEVIGAIEAEPVKPEALAMTGDKADDAETGPVALDELPGFPWTARFIGLWTRETASSCPDDLRDAMAHWQRWADTQPSGAPIPEEASNELKAMLALWRESGEPVPGLSSDDAVVDRLVEEADYDPDLAALLPEVMRARVTQEI